MLDCGPKWSSYHDVNGMQTAAKKGELASLHLPTLSAYRDGIQSGNTRGSAPFTVPSPHFLYAGLLQRFKT